MKRVLFVCCLTLLLLPSTGHAGSIFSGHVDTNGFIEPMVQIGDFYTDTVTFLGARGGVIFDHKLMAGASIYTMLSDVIITTEEDSTRLVKVTYGGFELEYTFWSDSVVHPTISTLLGVGGIKYRNPLVGSFYDPDSDTVFVAAPMLQIMINITDFARLAFGGGYRYVSGVDLRELSDSDTSGAYGSVGLKLGAF